MAPKSHAANSSLFSEWGERTILAIDYFDNPTISGRAKSRCSAQDTAFKAESSNFIAAISKSWYFMCAYRLSAKRERARANESRRESLHLTALGLSALHDSRRLFLVSTDPATT